MRASSHAACGARDATRRSAIVAALAVLCALPGVASTAALQTGPASNVSQSAAPTEKAKPVRLSYRNGDAFRKAWLVTYADGPPGRENIYARHSFDDGASWSASVLLSRDAAGAPTGGRPVTTRDALTFPANNDKPTIYAPPVTSGPMVVVAWNSGYCPPEPAAATASGSYTSALQGTGDFDTDGVPDRPFHCVWVATTTDPGLAGWDVQQLTDARRDAIGEMLAGSSSGNAFAIAWQEDPSGLQPGEAEGHGDGGSGAHVSGGTNIWYAHAPRPDGATLRSNIVQLSDNAVAGKGQPGASRPNIHLSGGTAAVVYEESACPGGDGGKCIVYHAFPYASPDRGSAGTVVSDAARHARRARLVMQGAVAAGTSPLRTVLLWRESPTSGPGVPADIVVRRGRIDPAARLGSTGFRPDDILADAPQNMTKIAALGGDANAHRAVVRGSLVGLAYNLSPDMRAADPRRTAVPTANYNLYFVRSAADGAPGSWSAPLNLSRVDSPALTVVEPRLAPTPGTVVNPLTGRPDPGDLRDDDVLYVSYATLGNTVDGQSGRVYVGRSTDGGLSFEPFAPVSSAVAGESESQLRPMPDGSSTMVLWMGEQTPGDAQSKDAIMAIATAPLPDLSVQATVRPFVAGGQQTLLLTVLNRGPGDARRVVVAGALPEGLTPVGIGDPSHCTLQGRAFVCTIADVEAAGSRVFSLAVATDTAGSYPVNVSVASAVDDLDASDNLATASVVASAPDGVEPPPELPPLDGRGGGCSAAGGHSPLDPLLPLLIALALGGAVRPRAASGPPITTPRSTRPRH